jgi:hypothetical protein
VGPGLFSVFWPIHNQWESFGRVISSPQGFCVNTGQHKHKKNTYTHQTPTIPASERVKTVHTLDGSATVIGPTLPFNSSYLMSSRNCSTFYYFLSFQFSSLSPLSISHTPYREIFSLPIHDVLVFPWGFDRFSFISVATLGSLPLFNRFIWLFVSDPSQQVLPQVLERRRGGMVATVHRTDPTPSPRQSGDSHMIPVDGKQAQQAPSHQVTCLFSLSSTSYTNSSLLSFFLSFLF